MTDALRARVTETVFVKPMLMKTDEKDLKVRLFMDDISIVQAASMAEM